jgi:thiamine biosynthesis protein ThiS
MVIRLNGNEREIPAGSTVRALLESMKLSPDRVAIELNRRLLKTEKYDTVLGEGDEVEVVTFVGGGS